MVRLSDAQGLVQERGEFQLSFIWITISLQSSTIVDELVNCFEISKFSSTSLICCIYSTICAILGGNWWKVVLKELNYFFSPFQLFGVWVFSTRCKEIFDLHCWLNNINCLKSCAWHKMLGCKPAPKCGAFNGYYNNSWYDPCDQFISPFTITP